jgi:penicillin amidase
VSRSFGPSERLTVDLSDLDKSTLNLVIGQSGDPLSPNYLDQWPYWYAGKTFALPFSEGAVAAAAKHTLTLIP